MESADDVAAKIVSLIDNPVPELYTNPEGTKMVEGYYWDVAAFEDNLAKRQTWAS